MTESETCGTAEGHACPPTSGSPSQKDAKPSFSITIKGTRKGLSVALGHGDWQTLLSELDTRLAHAEAFFQGCRMTLQTGQRDINRQELQELMRTLERHAVELVSLRTASKATAEAAQALQVKLALAEVTPVQTGVARLAEQEISEGVLVRRTMRSGQSVRHPGHVVIIGDVNPGAEVVAGGDVVVWGRVRGMVHAGALGDEEAIVCALRLTPTQLRIGTHVAVSPEEKDTEAGLSKGRTPARGGKEVQPEVANVVDGQIVVVPFDFAKDRPFDFARDRPLGSR